MKLLPGHQLREAQARGAVQKCREEGAGGGTREAGVWAAKALRETRVPSSGEDTFEFVLVDLK